MKSFITLLQKVFLENLGLGDSNHSSSLIASISEAPAYRYSYTQDVKNLPAINVVKKLSAVELPIVCCIIILNYYSYYRL